MKKSKNVSKEDLKKAYYSNTNEKAAKKLGISVSTLNKRVKNAKIGLNFQ